MKKTLIYIASDARSGSTLLDYLLGNNEQVCSVGEFIQLYDHLNRTGIGWSWNWRCSCGKQFQQCSFWSRIIDEYEKKENQKLSGLQTRFPNLVKARYSLLIALLTLMVPFKKVKRAIQQYFYRDDNHIKATDQSFHVLDIICDVTGKNVIIDSSKYPQRLLNVLLSAQSQYSIKVIHLVRDARAVTFSKVKRSEQFGDKASYLYSMVGWLLNNLCILSAKSFVDPKDYIRVRYEDLCQNPQQVIAQLCHQFDLGYDPQMAVLKKTEKHNIAGSQHRFEKSTEIKLDQRWKSNMTASRRIIYYCVGFILNKLFGY